MGINDFQVQNIHLLTSYHYVYLQMNSLYTLLLLHTSSVPATPVVAAEPSYVACLPDSSCGGHSGSAPMNIHH